MDTKTWKWPDGTPRVFDGSACQEQGYCSCSIVDCSTIPEDWRRKYDLRVSQYSPEPKPLKKGTESPEPYRLMKIENGSHWPNPNDGDFAWRIVYGNPSRSDLLRAVAGWEAYVALATHPAGTLSMQQTLAMIRRAAKAKKE